MDKETFESLNGYVTSVTIKRNPEGLPSVKCKYRLETDFGDVIKSIYLSIAEDDIPDVMNIDTMITDKFFRDIATQGE